jgi:hypothetical protein
MEKLDLTKHTFDEVIPKVVPEKQKPVAFNLIMIIFLVFLVCVFIFLFNRYRDKDATDLFEKKVNAVINLTREKVNNEDFKKDYMLVKFPDNNNLITQKGKLVYDKDRLDQFSKGYIIIYKNNALAFKLSDGIYCATKGFDDPSYKLFIFGNCLNYDIDYKKK